MTCPVIQRDPLDKVKITADYSDWLPSGAAISSAAWVVPTGVTASGQSESSPDAINHFESDSGEEREVEIACTITTDETPTRKKTQRFILNFEKDC